MIVGARSAGLSIFRNRTDFLGFSYTAASRVIQNAGEKHLVKDSERSGENG